MTNIDEITAGADGISHHVASQPAINSPSEDLIGDLPLMHLSVLEGILT